MDLWNKITKWIDHNRGVAMSLMFFIITMGLLVGMVGCPSKTPGLIMSADNVPIPVTRAELNQQTITINKTLAEEKAGLEAAQAIYNEKANAFNNQLAAAVEDLDRQDQLKAELASGLQTFAMESAATGAFNPLSLLPLGFAALTGYLALGTSADNRRKDNVIESKKTATTTNLT